MTIARILVSTRKRDSSDIGDLVWRQMMDRRKLWSPRQTPVRHHWQREKRAKSAAEHTEIPLIFYSVEFRPHSYG
ncbi:hypothetical protein ABTH91_21450, partial [Acinetobacter baumannii]